MNWRHLLKSLFGASIGLVLVVFGIHQIVSVERRASWPLALATITDAEIISMAHDEDAPTIKLRVSYAPNGAAVESVVYTREFDSAKSGFVRRVLTDRVPDRFAAGQTVSVYYNPVRPEVAHRDVGSSYFTYVTTSFFILLGLVIVLASSTLEVVYLYVKCQRWRMQRYLNKSRQAFAAANAISGGRLVDQSDIADKRSATLLKLDQVERLVDEIGAEIAAIDSVFDHRQADDSAHGPTTNIESSSAPIETDPLILSAENDTMAPLRVSLLVLVIPLALSVVVSWFAPYFILTLQQSSEHGIECQVQRVLMGVIPVGRPRTIFNLDNARVEVRGTTRTKWTHALVKSTAIGMFVEAAPRPSGVTRFTMGIFTTWCIVLLGMFGLRDVYQSNVFE